MRAEPVYAAEFSVHAVSIVIGCCKDGNSGEFSFQDRRCFVDPREVIRIDFIAAVDVGMIKDAEFSGFLIRLLQMVDCRLHSVIVGGMIGSRAEVT